MTSPSTTIAAVIAIQWRLSSAEPIRWTRHDPHHPEAGVAGRRQAVEPPGTSITSDHRAPSDTAVLVVATGSPADGLIGPPTGRTYFADNWPDGAVARLQDRRQGDRVVVTAPQAHGGGQRHRTAVDTTEYGASWSFECGADPGPHHVGGRGAAGRDRTRSGDLLPSAACR